MQLFFSFILQSRGYPGLWSNKLSVWGSITAHSTSLRAAAASCAQSFSFLRNVQHHDRGNWSSSRVHRDCLSGGLPESQLTRSVSFWITCRVFTHVHLGSIQDGVRRPWQCIGEKAASQAGHLAAYRACLGACHLRWSCAGGGRGRLRMSRYGPLLSGVMTVTVDRHPT